jgi:hypothetical protein
VDNYNALAISPTGRATDFRQGPIAYGPRLVIVMAQ